MEKMVEKAIKDVEGYILPERHTFFAWLDHYTKKIDINELLKFIIFMEFEAKRMKKYMETVWKDHDFLANEKFFNGMYHAYNEIINKIRNGTFDKTQ